MTNSMTIFLVLLAYTAGCTCSDTMAGKPHTTAPLNEITHRSHMYTIILEKGEGVQLEASPIKISVMSIDPGKSCELLITDVGSHVMHRGWVNSDSYVAFAPQLVGRRGLKVASVGDNNVTLEIRYASYDMTFPNPAPPNN